MWILELLSLLLIGSGSMADAPPLAAVGSPGQEPAGGPQAVKVSAEPGGGPEIFSIIEESDSIDPGGTDFGTERVLCPPGTVAVGGGIESDEYLNVKVTTSAPAFGDGPGDNLFFQTEGTQAAPRAWHVGMRNDEPAAGLSHTFKAAVVCSDDTSVGTKVLRETIDAGTPANRVVECPNDTVCTMGGVEPQDALRMFVNTFTLRVGVSQWLRELALVSDQPAPRAFATGVVNEAGGQREYVAAAVFTRQLDSLVTSVSSGIAFGESYGIARAFCPPGTVAVGGAVGGNLQLPVTSLGPMYGRTSLPADRLREQPEGRAPAPVGWQASVRNAASGNASFKVAAVCDRRALSHFSASIPMGAEGR